MIKKEVKPNEVVTFLNELLLIDRRGIESLFNVRVFCNPKLARHPTVQVGVYGKKNPKYFVGMIGILNGLFGMNENLCGCISIELTHNNRINKFILMDKR